jgi:hypothetical protein
MIASMPSDEHEPIDPNESDVQRILRVVQRLDRKQTILNADFNGLYQTVLQLQRDVNFFTRRCEERGNLIREFVAQVQENGSVEKDAALEFLHQLECAGTPTRPPSGTHPSVKSVHEEFDVDEPTDPNKRLP